MYKHVELYDRTSVTIKTQDLTRLEQVLELMSASMGQLGKLTSQMNLETLTFMAGVATAELFMDAEIPVSTEFKFRDHQVNAIRSLGYCGIVRLYAGIKSASGHQKEVFQSTHGYFRDAFILQEAIALEKERDNPDEKYLAKLESALKRISESFSLQITAQTNAYQELKAWLSDPSRN